MKRKFVDVILAIGLLITVASAFAHTWQQATTLTEAGSTAMSADGRIICVVNSGNHPVISTNSESNFWDVATNSPPLGSAYLGNVAVSADGAKIFAALSTDLGLKTSMFVSTDQGATWAKRASQIQTFFTNYCVACSADGTKVIAASWVSPVFYSTNGGINCYTSSFPTLGSFALASSADGGRMIAGVVDPGANDGGVYFSSDFGATWTRRVSEAEYRFRMHLERRQMDRSTR